MNRQLYLGCDSGVDVWSWQEALVKKGLLKPDQVDGKYGPKTENATMQFQMRNNLKVDGIVGPITWGAMFPSWAAEKARKTNAKPLPALVDAIIEQAMAFKDVKEIDGPNRHVLIDKWNRELGVPLGSPWCLSFVQQVVKLAANRLGLADPLKPDTAHCKTLWQRVNPKMKIAPLFGQPGDIFVMIHKDGSGHVGFVTEVKAPGQYLTIEGNSNAEGSREGTMVRVGKTRKYSEIVGLIRVAV